MSKITIALAGNPNCGKTTLFNALTGSKQRVGNWPGVTVEHKEGNYTHKNTDIQVIDLPGIYSFSAYSLDEKVSREFILNENPDLVVNIVDVTNLERNLYLTTQLLEMKIPVIVVLNMMDIAKQRKIHLEVKHLATHLDCTVIPMIASKKKGLDELKDAIIKIGDKRKISTTQVQYDSVVEASIEAIKKETGKIAEEKNIDNRWLAIKLLEMDEIADEITQNKYQSLVDSEAEKIERHIGDEVDIVVADGRYGFIHGLARDVIHRHDDTRKTVSDFIDKVALNRFLGIPIFLGVMYLVFMLTINIGGAFIDFFDIFTGTIFVDGLGKVLENINFPLWLNTFIA
ncbi:MAG: ferrous iron transporter B, partial [Candidatus Cloacimonadota bacterium]|nr:ferrous iron transporter B [Candidatus Cloacimonadota bacterium]